MINGSDRVFGRARSGPETSNPPEFAAPLRGSLEGVPFQAAAGIPFHVAVASQFQSGGWVSFRAAGTWRSAI